MPSFVGIGTRITSGTTSASVAFPASSIAANRLAVLHRAIKPDTATAQVISGWTRAVNRNGGAAEATGVDVGPTRIVMDWKILDGTETTPMSLTQGNSPSSVTGAMSVFQLDNPANQWDVGPGFSGIDTTHAQGRSATAALMDLVAGDLLVIALSSDTDSTGGISNLSVTATNLTFGTVTTRLAPGGSSVGNDVGSMMFTVPVTAGTGGVNGPTFSFTDGTVNCGPVGFLRLREVAPASPKGKVIVGGVKKNIVSESVIIGGAKKTVVNKWVIQGGVKKSLV